MQLDTKLSGRPNVPRSAGAPFTMSVRCADYEPNMRDLMRPPQKPNSGRLLLRILPLALLPWLPALLLDVQATALVPNTLLLHFSNLAYCSQPPQTILTRSIERMARNTSKHKKPKPRQQAQVSRIEILNVGHSVY